MSGDGARETYLVLIYLLSRVPWLLPRYTEWMRWNGSSLRPTWADSVGNELYTHTDSSAIYSAYTNESIVMPSNNDFNLFENRNEAQDKRRTVPRFFAFFDSDEHTSKA